MTNEFSVIGHHHADVDDLLLLGGDGHHYRYDLTPNRIGPVGDSDGWVLNADAESPLPASEQVVPATWAP